MTNRAKQGDVILYPYLWRRQRDAGETEGRKTRPACLILRFSDVRSDRHHLVILAITSKPPSEGQKGLEVPDTERKRAGLSRYSRAWVIVSEYNYDKAEDSWYFEPSKPSMGSFSSAFLREIALALEPAFVRAGAKVDRTI